METESLSIILSVKRGVFRRDDEMSPVADAEFKEVRPTILKRDSNTCRYCGFRSLKWQEVHHLDDNHQNNSPNNLVTACPLCHLCHHIGFAGASGMADLIYLDPELGIDQADLNQVVRTLWIARRLDQAALGPMADATISKLLRMAVGAHREIGTSDPMVLGQFLLELDKSKYESRGKNLRGIYLLPRESAFEPQISYWAKEVYKGKPDMWIKAALSKLRKWGEGSAQAWMEQTAI